MKSASLIMILGTLGLSMSVSPVYGERREKVSFYARKNSESCEHIARNGILVKRENAPATVIILHGFSHDKYATSPLMLLFKKFNCFLFDFRAHGEASEGQTSTIGRDEVHDVVGAVKYIRSRKDLTDKPVFAFAFSMGAATAIEAQSQHPDLFDALFLDSPFASSDRVVEKCLNNFRFSLFGYEFDLPGRSYIEQYVFGDALGPILKALFFFTGGSRFARVNTAAISIKPIESIKKITAPIMIVICKKDEFISWQDVQQLWKNHQGIKRLFVSTDCRGHCQLIQHDPDEYSERVNAFFDDVLTGEIYTQSKEIETID